MNWKEGDLDGRFVWLKETDNIYFYRPHRRRLKLEAAKPESSPASVDKKRKKIQATFSNYVDKYHAHLFAEYFQRPRTPSRAVVTLSDVKDVVMFSSLVDIPAEFVSFFYLPAVDRLLRSLLLYMQYFVDTWRVVLARNEAKGFKLRHPMSEKREAVWRETLSDLRFIVARDYTRILLGLDGCEQFHHFAFSTSRSNGTRDVLLYELFYSFAQRAIEVALLERNNPVIAEEINRLFRVGFQGENRMKKYGITKLEMSILEHDFVMPAMTSNNPLIRDLYRSSRNIYFKDIGLNEFRLPRDADSYYLAIEMALCGREEYFDKANIKLGVLGYDRKMFDPMMTLSETSVKNDESFAQLVAQRLSFANKTNKDLTGSLDVVPLRRENEARNFDLKYFEPLEEQDVEQERKMHVAMWKVFRLTESRHRYDLSQPRKEKEMTVMPTVRKRYAPGTTELSKVSVEGLVSESDSDLFQDDGSGPVRIFSEEETPSMKDYRVYTRENNAVNDNVEEK